MGSQCKLNRMHHHPDSRQGKYDEADRLYVREMEIMGKVVGPDHPNVAAVLGNQALLLQRQVRKE